MEAVDIEQTSPGLVPLEAGIYHKINVVAKMVDMSERRIRLYEQQTDAQITRVARGNSGIQVRMYSPKDIFDIAAYKRSLGECDKLPAPITASVYLPRGGVGKTTLVNELACLFQLTGQRTLVIDLDPQASTTVVNGYDPEAEPDNYEMYGLRAADVISYTFANLLDFRGDVPGAASAPVSISEVIKKPYGDNGPHLIPADVTLSQLNYFLSQGSNRDFRIRTWIERGRKQPTPELDLSRYDIILFDNAPATSVMSRAAMVASDFCIMPVRLDMLSAKSVNFLNNELNALANAGLPCPRVIAVPNYFSPKTVRSNLMMQGLWQNYGEQMIGLTIRNSEIFPKSLLKTKPQERMPVSLQSPNHVVVSEDLRPIAQAILERFQEISNA